MLADNPTTAIQPPPEVALIVAMTKNRLIGTRQQLPWRLQDELKLFKSLTMGATVIMGRKTYTSIGRPLPGRENIVLSRSREQLAGVMVCKSLTSALTAASESGRKIFIIGGEDTYREALPIASELHISWIRGEFTGDCFFPTLNLSDWELCREEDYADFQYNCYRRKP